MLWKKSILNMNDHKTLETMLIAGTDFNFQAFKAEG